MVVKLYICIFGIVFVIGFVLWGLIVILLFDQCIVFIGYVIMIVQLLFGVLYVVLKLLI